VDWLRWVGRLIFLGSLLVAGSAAVNQLLSGNGRLSWTAAYFGNPKHVGTTYQAAV
jgi:hypothetical protein